MGDRRDPRLKEMAISCMLNTEVGAVLAVIRRPPDPNAATANGQFLLPSPEDGANANLLHSLKSLRSLVFHPQHGRWRTTDPSVYLSPFLDVVQSDEIPAAGTGVALSAVLKILRLDVFDECSPGARDAIHSVVFAVTNCRLERADPASEDAVIVRILQVLTAVVRARAAVLLTDHAVCTVVNTCFQVVQQSVHRSDLLQRAARHTMHDIVQTVFARLPELCKVPDNAAAELGDHSDEEEEEEDSRPVSGYGPRCMADIFHFLCSLLNVREVVDSAAEGLGSMSSDEDVQLFALVLINTAVEFGGEGIGRHPKLLRMIQDDLFYHLIHYATCSSSLVLSMICSTVLNLYQFLRRFD